MPSNAHHREQLEAILLAALGGDLSAIPTDPNWKGINPSSAEWKEFLNAEPFISFPIHPLPAKLQAFIDAHPDLDQRERDAICEMLEQLYSLPPRFFVIDQGTEFIVEREPTDAEKASADAFLREHP